MEPLSDAEAEAAIERFQEFLRFETISATATDTGAYVECAKFLKTQLQAIRNTNGEPLLKEIHSLPEAPDHSPVVVAHWPGKNPCLPILLLNSHYDVVPAELSAWTVPPFGAMRRDGKIYGRGTQDMKSVCMQYLEGIRRLHQLDPDWQPERDIYLTFVPDEEIGGAGMAAFLDSQLYRRLPGIALALDEGLASTNNVFDVFYGERLPWWVQVTATGPTGHGSRFIENTAVEQILEISQKAMAFRSGQRDLLQMKPCENCTHAVVAKRKQQKQRTLGDVTSLNITTLQAGVKVGNTFAYNVVPSIATCSFDIRISPKMEPQTMKDMLDVWCQECSKDPDQGSQVTWKSVEFEAKMSHATTKTDRRVNPWYGAFCDALQEMGCAVSPQVFPAATDSRFLRAIGIRALGFSPMRNTEILLHEHDEYILEANFLEGIGIYAGLIRFLGSQDKSIDSAPIETSHQNGSDHP